MDEPPNAPDGEMDPRTEPRPADSSKTHHWSTDRSLLADCRSAARLTPGPAQSLVESGPVRPGRRG
jgi:hypothetical protein